MSLKEINEHPEKLHAAMMDGPWVNPMAVRRPSMSRTLEPLNQTVQVRYDHGEEEKPPIMTAEEMAACKEKGELPDLSTDASKGLPEEPDYIKGEAPPPPPPRARDHTLTGYQIIPKGTRLLVWVEEAEHITAGGILLPDIAREEEELEEATVLAIGQGRYNADRGCFLGCNYEVGDRVWFRRTAHHLLTEIPGQKQLLLIQEDLCQAVLLKPVKVELGGVTEAQIALVGFKSDADLLKPQGDQADETESEEPDERPDHG